MKTPTHYTYWDVLLADPVKPMAESMRTGQIQRMQAGLASIETSAVPCTNDWRLCSDAVNLMETLVKMKVVEDHGGLLMDAITALALAGRRHLAGGHIRLDGPGIQAIRAVLEDYAEVLAVLPARTVIACHRATEKRLKEIMTGRRMPHDVEIVSL